MFEHKNCSNSLQKLTLGGCVLFERQTASRHDELIISELGTITVADTGLLLPEFIELGGRLKEVNSFGIWPFLGSKLLSDVEE